MHNTQERVGTAHDGLCYAEKQCQRLCPPYDAACALQIWQNETNLRSNSTLPIHPLRLRGGLRQTVS
jgi:hypothetical protein